jgi:hypothetical protein
VRASHRRNPFDENEAKKRFEAALRGARIAGHKPMTDIPKKREASKPTSRPRSRQKINKDRNNPKAGS